MVNVVTEIYRHSFPKNLRYCKQCQILHAQLYSLERRFKHKRYIPRVDVQDILKRYEPMPGAPLLQLPIVRHLLLIRLINAVRVMYFGKPSWLFTRAVATEHQKIVEWFDKQLLGGGATPNNATAAASTPSATSAKGTASSPKSQNRVGSSSSSSTNSTTAQENGAPNRRYQQFVLRESLQKDVLQTFVVAEMYHRGFRAGAFFVLALLLFVILELFWDVFLALYLWLWKGYRERDQVLQYFREVTECHMIADVPASYAGKLPPPAVLHRASTSDRGVSPATNNNSSAEMSTTTTSGGVYEVTVAEFESPDQPLTVLCIPVPFVGDLGFYERVGAILRQCDLLLLEDVPMSSIANLPPAYFLPLKESTFSYIGLHHRVMDILRSAEAPPMLYPGTTTPGLVQWIAQGLIPFEARCVYFPTLTFGSKAHARLGWGRLREVLHEYQHLLEDGGVTPRWKRTREAALLAAAAAKSGTEEESKLLQEVKPGEMAKWVPKEGERVVIGLPWSVNQMVNMEASLVRLGFTLRRTSTVKWLPQDYMGEHFCQSFGW